MRILQLSALVLALGSGAVHAGLEICNDTEVRQSVAIGYKSGDDWMSEGWWNLAADTCGEVIRGDLTNRYYYVLAQAAGWSFVHENVLFCTATDAFTITGDENCEARGLVKSRFRTVDTGKTAKHFKVSLAAMTAPETPPPPDREAGAGAYGEPYASSTAIFQDCIDETEAPFCTFHADGTKFFVTDDGRTPAAVMRGLRGYLPGTPIAVSGDLVGIYDHTADIVLRQALPRAWNGWDSILAGMQGHWYSVDDPASQFTVLGSERENTYDGGFQSVEYLAPGSACEHFSGGEYLIVTDADSAEVLCYTIETVGDWDMTWMYLPRGNFHDFRKLD